MEVQDPDYPSKKPRLYNNVLNDISAKSSDSNIPIAGCSTYNASLDDKKINFESEDFYKSPLVPIASDENMYLWQQRQVAKAIVENTINNVLESYLSHSGVDNLGDLGLEESAILMAISEHGLQHTTQMPHDVLVDDDDVERNGLFYLNDVQADSVDFMEAAVGAAIQRKGLTPSASSASTEPSTSTAQR